MKDQTKLVEKIFAEDVCYVNSWAPYYVHKLLNVYDPENWYHSDKIICEMFHSKHWDGPHKDTVRILFKSYDDFMMYRDFDYYSLGKNWKFCMKHYFNKLPDTVDVDWLYKNGYVPF